MTEKLNWVEWEAIKETIIAQAIALEKERHILQRDPFWNRIQIDDNKLKIKRLNHLLDRIEEVGEKRPASILITEQQTGEQG